MKGKRHIAEINQTQNTTGVISCIWNTQTRQICWDKKQVVLQGLGREERIIANGMELGGNACAALLPYCKPWDLSLPASVAVVCPLFIASLKHLFIHTFQESTILEAEEYPLPSNTTRNTTPSRKEIQQSPSFQDREQGSLFMSDYFQLVIQKREWSYCLAKASSVWLRCLILTLWQCIFEESGYFHC